jgi:hypothetical protein
VAAIGDSVDKVERVTSCDGADQAITPGRDRLTLNISLHFGYAAVRCLIALQPFLGDRRERVGRPLSFAGRIFALVEKAAFAPPYLAGLR